MPDDWNAMLDKAKVMNAQQEVIIQLGSTVVELRKELAEVKFNVDAFLRGASITPEAVAALRKQLGLPD